MEPTAAGTIVSEEISLTDDVLHVVKRILENSVEPQSAKQIHDNLTGALRIPRKELEPLLEQAAAEGKIHAHGKFRGTPTYFHQSLEVFAPELICRAASRKPLTASELRQAVKTRLGSFGEKRIDDIRKSLVREERLQELPAVIGGRSKLYSVHSAAAKDYVANAVEKIESKLKSLGVSGADITAALQSLGETRQERSGTPRFEPEPLAQSALDEPAGSQSPDPHAPAAEDTLALVVPRSSSPTDLPQRILDRMKLLDPKADLGAPVSVRELRTLNDFQHEDRGEFDRALWKLIEDRQLAAHQFDSLGTLTEQEKSIMLIDDRGRHFHLVSRRQ